MQVIMMNIKSLKKMESIVAKNHQLFWDGWTVVHSVKNPTAWSSPNGAYVKGKWYIQKRYEPTIDGWEIPDKLVR